MRRGSSPPASREVRATLRLIRDLQSRRGRERTGLYYAEGIGFLLHGVDQAASVERIVVSFKLLTSTRARQTVRRLRREGVPCVSLSPEEFRSIGVRERACGVGVVFRQCWQPIEALDPRVGVVWLVLREVRSPGNLGTLLRTLAAAGGGGVILLGESVDVFDPAVVRATMGGVFGLQFARATSAQLVRLRRRTHCRILGSSPAARQTHAEFAWRPGTLVFLGEERQGLGAEDLELCDDVVRIPMTGAVDSLNLGVAGSLMIYEAFRAAAEWGQP